MLWQGAKWRILKNFNVQNEECHNYEFICFAYEFMMKNGRGVQEVDRWRECKGDDQ